MTGGYWQAPRWLPQLLESGELTPSEYALVNYAAQAGADRPHGVSMTVTVISGLLGVSPKTASRALHKLAGLQLLEHDLKSGMRRPIRVRLGRRFVGEPRTQPPSPGTEVMSEVTSDTRGEAMPLNPALRQEPVPPSTSDTSRARRDRDLNEYISSVVNSFLGAGGSLELAEWRSALERQAHSLGQRDVPLERVVAAAKQLGRKREFPGYLRREAEAIEAAGGVCAWQMPRHGLTLDQLIECGCGLCADWVRVGQAKEALLAKELGA
jgi:hypothetical protein